MHERSDNMRAIHHFKVGSKSQIKANYFYGTYILSMFVISQESKKMGEESEVWRRVMF